MIGTKINNYELVSLLGEGGMGAVYVAHHPFLGRKAAVKVLRPELAQDRSLVSRFLNEARAANAIGHPNIIDVLDVGVLADGLPYMLMELLRGETLAKRLSRVRLSLASAVSVARQTASALAAAHEKGIVHRDLKPENLFLLTDTTSPGGERVKVLDFGIAKLRGDGLRNTVKTRAGAIMGTPMYMSPEQCRGTDEIDHRSDIYALGIILYEMVCGEAPFVGEGVGDVLVKHLLEPVVPPSSRNPEVAPALEHAIMRALAKNREERFATMTDFLAVLEGREPTEAPLGTIPPMSEGVAATVEAAAFTRSMALNLSASAQLRRSAVAPPAEPPAGEASEPVPAASLRGTTFSMVAGEADASAEAAPKSRRGLAMAAIGGVVLLGGLVLVAFLPKHPAAPAATPAAALPGPAAAAPAVPAAAAAPAVVAPAAAPAAAVAPAPAPAVASAPAAAPTPEAPEPPKAHAAHVRASARPHASARAIAARPAPPAVAPGRPATPPVPPPAAPKAAQRW